MSSYIGQQELTTLIPIFLGMGWPFCLLPVGSATWNRRLTDALTDFALINREGAISFLLLDW